MFEVYETGAKVSKEDYKKRLPELRSELLQTQFALRDKNIPLLIIISGVDGAGKGEVVNRLNSWMDTRFIETHVFRQQTDEETNRPPYWKFWRVMPGAGDIGIFFGSWYTKPIVKRVLGENKKSEFDSELNRITTTERMLHQSGMIIAKFWLHISKDEQKNRFKALEKDERTKWRVTDQDWANNKNFESFLAISERAIRSTDTLEAPWHVLDASHDRYRDIAVMEILLQKMKNALERHELEEKNGTAAHHIAHQIAQPVNILSTVDLNKSLSKSEYKAIFSELSLEIENLAWQCFEQGISSVFVFEGWDAAGKGSAIRRLISSLDAKIYRVIQIAAPSDEEKAHHYLWRFWRHIPKDGKITIYDRSWYGRVMVERVEGFAKTDEWKRSYSEINEFEQQLTDHGTIVEKFWLHISKDEQLRRFKEREKVPYKMHKLTEDDWRNREKWEPYEKAVHDMIARTSTEFAPWHIISGNNKNYARIQILNIIKDALARRLK